MNFNYSHVKAFIKKDFSIEHSTKNRILYEVLSVSLRLLFIFFISSFLRQSQLIEGSYSYFEYILIGFCFLDIGSSVIMSIPKSIMAFKTDGTFEEILQNPLNATQLLTLTSSYALIVSFIKMMMYLLLAFAIDNEIYSSLIVVINLIILSILYIASCVGFSLIIGSLTLIYFSPVRFLAINSVLSMVISGIFFPISQFSVFLDKLSYLLPLRLANEIGRSLVIKEGLLEIELVILLVSEIILYFVLGYFVLKKAVTFAKKKGTLLYY